MKSGGEEVERVSVVHGHCPPGMGEDIYDRCYIYADDCSRYFGYARLGAYACPESVGRSKCEETPLQRK